MDFVQDSLYNNQKFRVLTIVIILVKNVWDLNGSEFISKEVDKWAYENEVTMDFSRPENPTDNPYVNPLMENLEMNVYP
ncbi:hypothetical protein CMU71_12825 [Elizabethkingia anophelis]|uniref:hypothetical protein n=1 Tax=Elizabethkingia anophelis TaxID=1117645 RepID=UPI00293CB710|nr:hypothetical protein [Elizabethkingia anophelis]MDV3969453.1 hypothetical protein [Elizabethkingia anophelis]